MPRKKVVLFIVEGETDKEAVGLLLEKLIRSASVEFDVFRSDIFGRSRAGSGEDPIMIERNILKRVNAEVAHYLDGAEYRWSDLERIVLLADADGCFIPDDHVVGNPACKEKVYFDDHVESAMPERVVSSNRERSANLMTMVRRGVLTKRGVQVPVAVYFLSRNLEHALHGEAGSLNERRKVRLAREFRQRYQNDVDGFVDFLATKIAVPGDYLQSWDYLREGTHSLERGTNLHLLLTTSVEATRT